MYRRGEYFTTRTHLILTWTLQRAPHCDYVLVHDDDLERILRVGDGTVSSVVYECY